VVLGALAALLERWEEAARHFDVSMRTTLRLGARPFVALTGCIEAVAWLRRGRREDLERTERVLSQAGTIAAAIGATAIVERIRHLRSAAAELGAGRPPEPQRVPVDDTEEARLVAEGDTWLASFAGRQARIRDAKGIHYIALLLRDAHRSIHVSELVGSDRAMTALPAGAVSTRETAGMQTVPGLGDAGEALDPQAKREYATRLRELDEEISAAEEWADLGRVERLREERTFLATELTRSLGLGGRVRKSADNAERMRKAVANRIRDAVDRVRDLHPSLGAHLEESIRTGLFCVYGPTKTIPWVVDLAASRR